MLSSSTPRLGESLRTLRELSARSPAGDLVPVFDADVVAFAELDAVVAEDRVRGGDVEVKVRHGDAFEIRRAAHRLTFHPRRRDTALLGASAVGGLQRPEAGRASLDPRLQLGDRLLGVGV